MSRLAVMSIRRATTDEAGWASAGDIGRSLADHGIIDAAASAADGPELADGSTGFLLKGVDGMTAARVGDGAAATGTDVPDQVLVMQGDTVYLPARPGQVISLIEIT